MGQKHDPCHDYKLLPVQNQTGIKEAHVVWTNGETSLLFELSGLLLPPFGPRRPRLFNLREVLAERPHVEYVIFC